MKIQFFEQQALKKIVEQINEDYAEQRRKSKDFEMEDIDIDQIKVTIEDEKVVRINLDDLKLTRIPKAVGELTNLKELWLYGNQIIKISGLDNLTNLQELLLGNNLITKISGLDNLTNLRNLWIGGNQITEISGLENLTNLQYLWINGNPISTTDKKTKEQIKSLRGRKVNVII